MHLHIQLYGAYGGIMYTMRGVVVYRKFAPRCSVCDQPIMPASGSDEAVRIVAMDKSFHPHCYKCEVSERRLVCFVYSVVDLVVCRQLLCCWAVYFCDQI